MHENIRHIEPALLEACFQGDEKAQFTLYKKYYGLLYSICRRYAVDEDEAGLLLNNGFLKIIKGLHLYKKEIPFEAWIRRIMINVIIDEHRKNKRYKETFDLKDNPADYATSARIDFNEAEKLFDAQELIFFIEQLPPMSAKVFNLYAIDGYSHKEIGNMLAISDGTSKWHLSNARKKLQEMISDTLASRRRNLTVMNKGKSA